MDKVEEFKSGKIVVNCQTEQQAEYFIIWCYNNNIRWVDELGNNGNNIPNTHYCMHFNGTCYRCDNGCLVYGKKNTYDDKTMFEIVTYEEFFKDKEIRLIKNKEMELSDLKSGQQVVKIRNGERYLVLKNNIDSICLFGIGRSFALTGYYDNDMFCKDDNNKDIVAVYDIERSGFGLNLHHLLKQGIGLKLVWERKEDVKEMTLDEVNKILQDTKGFKVKIVE